MKTLSFVAETPLTHQVTIHGKRFEIRLNRECDGDWHWLITAPGEIVLSGNAPSEMQAMDCACRAGRALARLAPA